MQVQHIEGTEHFVIGTAAPKAMRTSNLGGIYALLSTSLYSDALLATLREPICNAWDAHKAAGTMRPIEVTLKWEAETSSTEVRIRDFGHGIPHESMMEIYGVYGESTKEMDDDATGGFGIGCKAPFSMLDSFQVRNSHNGVCKVYSILRAMEELNGVPGIVELASFPAAESGLEVILQIPARNASNRGITDKLLSITSVSDMPTLVNGTLAPGRTPSEKVGNDWNPSLYFPEYVIYGNVRYPLDVSKIQIPHLRSSCTIPFLNLVAEPGTLTVTPSRESLKYSERTVKALEKLVLRAAAEAKQETEEFTQQIQKSLDPAAIRATVTSPYPTTMAAQTRPKRHYAAALLPKDVREILEGSVLTPELAKVFAPHFKKHIGKTLGTVRALMPAWTARFIARLEKLGAKVPGEFFGFTHGQRIMATFGLVGVARLRIVRTRKDVVTGGQVHIIVPRACTNTEAILQQLHSAGFLVSDCLEELDAEFEASRGKKTVTANPSKTNGYPCAMAMLKHKTYIVNPAEMESYNLPYLKSPEYFVEFHSRASNWISDFLRKNSAIRPLLEGKIGICSARNSVPAGKRLCLTQEAETAFQGLILELVQAGSPGLLERFKQFQAVRASLSDNAGLANMAGKLPKLQKMFSLLPSEEELFSVEERKLYDAWAMLHPRDSYIAHRNTREFLQLCRLAAKQYPAIDLELLLQSPTPKNIRLFLRLLRGTL